MKKVLIVIFLTLGLNFSVYAQAPLKVPEVISTYLEALKTKNRKMINIAWENLDQDKVAIEYLKRNMPKVYRSYRLKAIAYRLEDLSNKVAAEPPGAVATKSSPTRTGDQSNRAVVRGSPNQNLPSNNNLSRDLLNQRAIPNTISSVEDLSPRNIESNQDYIRHAK